MNPRALFSILYAPLRYTDPDHHQLHGLDLTRLPKSLANQWLIEHWALPVSCDFAFRHDPDIITCVRSWSHLRRICYLLGLLRVRTPLIEQAWYPRLDELARQFLLIRVPAVPTMDAGIRLQESDIFAAGSACLAPVFRRMPPALRARLPLLFPSSVTRSLTEQLRNPSTDTAIPPFLFSLAHHYALDTHTPTPRPTAG